MERLERLKNTHWVGNMKISRDPHQVMMPSPKVSEKQPWGIRREDWSEITCDRGRDKTGMLVGVW